MLLYGGAAGGGKSSWLVAEASRYVEFGAYRAILLRENYTDAKDLIDKADKIYMQLGEKRKPRWNGKDKVFIWPSGAKIFFGHLSKDTDIKKYDGLLTT